MQEVAFITRYVPQYRRPFLECARSLLDEEGVRLRVLYGQPNTAEVAKGDAVHVPWGEYARNLIVPLGHRDVYVQPVLRRAWGADLLVVEQGSRLLLNYLLVPAQRAGGPRVAYWGHGLHFAAHEVTRLGEAAKRLLATRAHWWFAYTERSAQVVAGMGYPRERVTVIGNAIDTGGLREERARVGEAELQRLRRELGLAAGARLGVYCGALYPEKRLGFLVAACDRIRRLVPEFELVVVGGGEDEPLVRAAAASRPWLHYVGPLFGADKVRHLALGEVFLLPGLVGLAVLDAFALELPIVSTPVDYHSHEVSYLEDGVNGLMVAAADDAAAYAEGVAALLTDEARLQALRAGCRASAEKYTVEKMAARFAGGVMAALAAPPRAASSRPPAPSRAASRRPPAVPGSGVR
jgi:glycosyltransferase involved in cell wall biosynthesis